MQIRMIFLNATASIGDSIWLSGKIIHADFQVFLLPIFMNMNLARRIQQPIPKLRIRMFQKKLEYILQVLVLMFFPSKTIWLKFCKHWGFIVQKGTLQWKNQQILRGFSSYFYYNCIQSGNLQVHNILISCHCLIYINMPRLMQTRPLESSSRSKNG